MQKNVFISLVVLSVRPITEQILVLSTESDDLTFPIHDWTPRIEDLMSKYTDLGLDWLDIKIVKAIEDSLGDLYIFYSVLIPPETVLLSGYWLDPALAKDTYNQKVAYNVASSLQ